MDGSERQSLVTEGLGLPNGITIDFRSSQVCWADAGKNVISTKYFFVINCQFKLLHCKKK